jgi:predicted ribonuclease YlaK
MKAKSLGINAQDYKSDKVQGFDKLYSGRRVIEGLAERFRELDQRVHDSRRGG